MRLARQRCCHRFHVLRAGERGHPCPIGVTPGICILVVCEPYSCVAMDFTLENWEQLGLDPGDLFWDTVLDNYRDLFLLSEWPVPRLPCALIL